MLYICLTTDTSLLVFDTLRQTSPLIISRQSLLVLSYRFSTLGVLRYISYPQFTRFKLLASSRHCEVDDSIPGAGSLFTAWHSSILVKKQPVSRLLLQVNFRHNLLTLLLGPRSCIMASRKKILLKVNPRPSMRLSVSSQLLTRVEIGHHLGRQRSRENKSNESICMRSQEAPYIFSCLFRFETG